MHLLVLDVQRDLELDREPTGLSDLLGVEGAGRVKRYLLFRCRYVFTVTSLWQQELRCLQPCAGVEGAGGRHQQETQTKPLVQSSQLIGLKFWASGRVAGAGNTKPALGAHFNFNHLVRV